jgi:cytochrome-b5 reductase
VNDYALADPDRVYEAPPMAKGSKGKASAVAPANDVNDYALADPDAKFDRMVEAEGKERFNMLAGGMGLAPMYQILWKMLFTPADERKAVLIYHSRTTADILLRRELDEWARALPHRLTVVHVVGDAPDAAPPEGWKTTDTYVAESGEVDKAKLSKYSFAPSKETLCFICGPTALYTALCGPREERALRQGTVLDQLGYTSSMIAKL